MNRVCSQTACALAVCTLVLAVPKEARSSETPTAAELREARERFAEGRRLEDAGHFGEALIIFQNVARVKMTPQVRFHLALCWMNLGKPVDALVNFRLAVQEAGDSAPNVVTEAKEHIATLETRVAVVIVDIPAGDDTLSVTLDERAVTTGIPLDVETGNHRIVLRKSGQTVDERWLTLGASERSHVELAPRPQPPPPTNVGTNASTNVPNTVPPPSGTNTSTRVGPVRQDAPHDTGPTPSPGMNGRQVASLVAFGVAGVGIIGVSTFAVLRASRLAELEAACPTFKGCSPSLEPVVEDGKMYASGVNILAVMTGVATTTGIVLYALSQRTTSRQASTVMNVQLCPMVGLGSGFVALQGRF